MLGWRRRKDGFEWREYVRTTILVRRKHRRDRIGQAANAAVDNFKAAGQRGAVAGAEGVKAVGRGAVHAGQHGAMLGAAGAKAIGRGAVRYGHQGVVLAASGAKAAAVRFRQGLPVAGSYLQRFGAALIAGAAYVWAVLGTLVGIVSDYTAPVLAPVGRTLRQPSVRLPLLIAGGVSLLGGIIRAFANGFVQDTIIALTIGASILGALALAHLATGAPSWLSSSAAWAGDRLRGRFRGITASSWLHGAVAVAALAVLAAGAIAAWRSSPGTKTTVTRQAHQEEQRAVAPSGDVEGRGTAITGDTLRVGGTTVRLNGIEAPEPDQTCTAAAGSIWECGEEARQALAHVLRGGRVACDVAGAGEGPESGDCRVGEVNVAAELVRGGHVFAKSGLFAPYANEESDARAKKAGIWAGPATRPSDYRAQKWEEAKREAPDGCPIKGNVRGGRRFYVVPWARGYERVRVSRSRGERWFCSESEAREAGFKPFEQS